MDSKTYLEKSKRTVSEEFHPELIKSSDFSILIHNMLSVGEQADVTKAALFYGRDPKMADYEIMPSNVPMKSMDPSLVNPHMLHSILGIFSEAVELMEILAAIMSGEKTDLDLVNLIEEQGDIEFFMAMLYRAVNADPAIAKKINIDKLRKRFPVKFTTENANERDLNTERQTLEDGVSKATA